MNQWLDWAKKIKAISQIGNAYSKDVYDLDRYDQLSAIADEILANLADAPVARVAHFFVPDSGYATPKIDLRAGVFRDGKVLLVKERLDGLWTLPGGWADVCESPKQGIQREVLEESGFQVDVKRLVAVKDRSLHCYTPQYPDHLFKLFFLCDLIGGKPTLNIEIDAIDFFPLDDLPELSQSRILAEDIALLWDYQQHPEKLVYCD